MERGTTRVRNRVRAAPKRTPGAQPPARLTTPVFRGRPWDRCSRRCSRGRWHPGGRPAPTLEPRVRLRERRAREPEHPCGPSAFGTGLPLERAATRTSGSHPQRPGRPTPPQRRRRVGKRKQGGASWCDQYTPGDRASVPRLRAAHSTRQCLLKSMGGLDPHSVRTAGFERW